MSCYSLNIFLFSETECVETALIILSFLWCFVVIRLILSTSAVRALHVQIIKYLGDYQRKLHSASFPYIIKQQFVI